MFSSLEEQETLNLLNPQKRIDFKTQIAGLRFDDAFKQAEKFEVRDFLYDGFI